MQTKWKSISFIIVINKYFCTNRWKNFIWVLFSDIVDIDFFTRPRRVSKMNANEDKADGKTHFVGKRRSSVAEIFKNPSEVVQSRKFLLNLYGEEFFNISTSPMDFRNRAPWR